MIAQEWKLWRRIHTINKVMWPPLVHKIGYGCLVDTFQVTRLTFTIEIMMMLFQEVYHHSGWNKCICMPIIGTRDLN